MNISSDVSMNLGGAAGVAAGVGLAQYALRGAPRNLAGVSLTLGMGAAGALSGLLLGKQMASPDDSATKKAWTLAISSGVGLSGALAAAHALKAGSKLAMPVAGFAGVVAGSLLTSAVLAAS